LITDDDYKKQLESIGCKALTPEENWEMFPNALNVPDFNNWSSDYYLSNDSTLTPHWDAPWEDGWHFAPLPKGI
jgi:hypothetical protein